MNECHHEREREMYNQQLSSGNNDEEVEDKDLEGDQCKVAGCTCIKADENPRKILISQNLLRSFLA